MQDEMHKGLPSPPFERNCDLHVPKCMGGVDLFRRSRLSEQWPKARQSWETTAQSYAAGLVGLTDVLDTQRTLLTVRLAVAVAQTTREKKLAEFSDDQNFSLSEIIEASFALEGVLGKRVEEDVAGN